MEFIVCYIGIVIIFVFIISTIMLVNEKNTWRSEFQNVRRSLDKLQEESARNKSKFDNEISLLRVELDKKCKLKSIDETEIEKMKKELDFTKARLKNFITIPDIDLSCGKDIFYKKLLRNYENRSNAQINFFEELIEQMFTSSHPKSDWMIEKSIVTPEFYREKEMEFDGNKVKYVQFVITKDFLKFLEEYNMCLHGYVIELNGLSASYNNVKCLNKDGYSSAQISLMNYRGDELKRLKNIYWELGYIFNDYVSYVELKMRDIVNDYMVVQSEVYHPIFEIVSTPILLEHVSDIKLIIEPIN